MKPCLNKWRRQPCPHYPVFRKRLLEVNEWESVPIPAISLLSLGKYLALAGVYVASGLGSSGLTTGPIIGYHLAQLIQDRGVNLGPSKLPN